ncbi:MAG TPA: tRNA (adenosine(37)-N6)-dimethylallyltransferase MiaA, partial [Chthoniobacterales bacterium]
MIRVFCIVGPTAIGKSELAAEIANRVGGEIVNADAFQIYQGFDVLSGKPDASTLRKAPHHLIGTVPPTEQMSAARYRALALPVIADINSRGKLPVLAGGSGLYIKALTHGLAEMPPPDAKLRQELDEMSTSELRSRLTTVDPESAKRVDVNNRRRLIRAIEIAFSTGRSASVQRTQWADTEDKQSDGGDLQCGIGFQPMNLESSASRRCHVENLRPWSYTGVFVFRDRDELYQRINERVETMLDNGAIDEVREASQLSATVEQMIGIRDIRAHLSGDVSREECLARIQQLTRRYAKRQLTWFRRQINLIPLNLSLLSNNEA